MSDIFEKYPLPWIVHDEPWLDGPCIRDANDSLVLYWDDVELLHFIVKSANSKVTLLNEDINGP